MKKALFVLGAGVAMCVVGATQSAHTQSALPAQATAAVPVLAPAPARTVANVPMPTLTPEEQKAFNALIVALRPQTPDGRSSAQRAVRDADEGLFREPTAAEAAFLSTELGGDAPEVFELPGGGVAVSTGAAGMSFVTASVDAQGRLVVKHEATAAGKEQRRDQ